MYDLRWVPIAVAAGGELASSALPDAPVIPVARLRKRGRLRGFAERLVASRPRLRATRLAKEKPCAT
jgi:hypothetical protein